MNAPVRPGDLVRPAHKKAARLIGMALTIHESLAYAHLARGLVDTLTPEECHGLAWAALHACAPDKAAAIAADRLDGHEPADMPDLAAFDLNDLMPDATFWAGMATHEQRRAYAVACLAHMSEEERHACVLSLQGRTGA